MMNMMVADIGREPAHDGAGLHEAGGFQGSLVVSPTAAFIKRDAREIVLRVKKVGADSAGDEMRNDQRKQQAAPAGKRQKEHCKGEVQTKGKKTVIVPARISERRSDAHSV